MSFHTKTDLDPLAVLDKFAGSTLVLPGVTIGNIPQLATDLLLYNLPDVQLVGRLDSTWVYPFVAPADFTRTNKTSIPDYSVNSPVTASTALEVYYSERTHLTIIQQRSPILPGCSQNFFKELIIPFIGLGDFKCVMFLQSKDKGLREDRFSDKPFQLWTNDLAHALEVSLNLSEESNRAVAHDCSEVSPVADYLFKELGKETTRANEHQKVGQSSAMERSSSNIFTLIKSAKNFDLDKASMKEEANIGCIAISMFVYEGDNSEDARELYREVLQVLRIPVADIKKLKTPKSWEGVYGTKLLPVGMEYGLYT